MFLERVLLKPTHEPPTREELREDARQEALARVISLLEQLFLHYLAKREGRPTPAPDPFSPPSQKAN